MLHMDPPPGKDSAVAILKDARLFNMTPSFHAAGIGTMTFFAVWLQCCSVVLPPSPKPIDALEVASALKYANVSSMLVIPSILEDLSKDPTLSDALRNVSNVIWAGSAVPKDAGNKLKHKAHLISYMGSTEYAIFPHLIVEDPDDWEYVAVDPCYNLEFRHQASDLYEAVIVRSEEYQMYQPIWHVFPDLKEYRTSELYSKHPEKPDLWMYRGRKDDIIVFVNGEKLNPVTMEDHVCGHPLVKSALVTGEGRFQAALLVEPLHPLKTTAERAELLADIWPLIEKGNEANPRHGKISKGHVLFTKPEAPMLRAGKGTVQRRLTMAAYATEIEKVYADAELFTNAESRPPGHEVDIKSLRSLILRTIRNLAGHDLSLGPEDDFFSGGGLDSLQVLQLVRQLRGCGQSSEDRDNVISPSIVYSNPSASSLAEAVQAVNAASHERAALSLQTKTKEMQDLLRRFSGPKEDPSPEQPDVVMVTSSTGHLAPYIFDSLLREPGVEKIFCLGREASMERQTAVSASRGLSTEFEKAEFFKANLAVPFFGLDEQIFERLSSTVTKIIHIEWTVDFNLSLQSFCPHLQGLRALIDFAAAPARPKSIFFISSVSSMGNWPHSSPLPEINHSDPSLPIPTGYSQSKFIAEQLLLGSTTTVDASVCRLGQLAGPALHEKGIWKEKEWVPSLVKSSAYLKLVPDSLGSISEQLDWLPVDSVAGCIVELALLPRDLSSPVYHLVNPRTCNWQSLMLPVLAGLGKDVQVTTFKAWTEALRASAAATFEKNEYEKNPAIKLLDFYESLQNTSLPQFSTVETEKRSKGLREMKAIGPSDMQRWMRQWGFTSGT